MPSPETQSHVFWYKAEVVQRNTDQTSVCKEFLGDVKRAYIATATYMLKKMPLENKLLQCLSAIDRIAQGHSKTFQALVTLGTYFPTVLKEEEVGIYKEECRALQINTALPAIQADGRNKRVDKWWAEVFVAHSYPMLSKVVKACLSICTGPQVEQSFSMMNNIITSKTNRLDVQTYAAIMAIKYDLKAKDTTTLTMYHRDDIQRDPVDKGVAFYLQTSYNRYKKRLVDIQHKKEEKRKSLNLSKPKGSKKKQVHLMVSKISESIKKKTGKIRKRKLSCINNETVTESKQKKAAPL